MLFSYPQARAVALRVINRYGGDGQIVLKGVTGGYDDAGDVVADTADQTFFGTITPLIDYSNNELDGESIIMGDAWVLWQGVDNIAIDMQIELNFQTFRIVDVMNFSSINNVNVFVRLQLRK